MNDSNQNPHDDLAASLIRRGLPADYAERAAAELADHHRDLMAELRATGLSESHAAAEASRRLGDTRKLAKKTIREYQRRFWCGRWTLLTFLLGPIPLLLVTWVATALITFCIAWPLTKLGILGPEEPDGIISFREWVIDKLVVAWFLFALPALMVLVFARLAKRAALRWQWVGLVACLLACFVGMVKSGFPDPSLRPKLSDGSELPADMYVLTVGLPLLAPHLATPEMLLRSWWKWCTHDWEQTAQFLLPLIVASIVVLRTRLLSLPAERFAVVDS